MHLPFLTADPHSGLLFRPTDTQLAEISLAPLPLEWAPASAITETANAVWKESLFNAPAETIAAVTSALEDLVLATPDLRVPSFNELSEILPQGRAARHLSALIDLWRRMGEALPQGLAAVRHVLELPKGQFLTPMPVAEGTLDPLAPMPMRALYDRLKNEFGSVPASPPMPAAAAGTRLHDVQNGLASDGIKTGPADQSLSFFGLRDIAACADFAAARAQALMAAGCPAREIAVMTAGDPRQIGRAFASRGVPISGMPASPPERDVVGEAVLHLLLAKRPPTPAMVLAAIALSPLMPWDAQTGRDLAEELMGGSFRTRVLDTHPNLAALWEDICATASTLPQLRFLIERICDRLSDGHIVRSRLPLLIGEGSPDWETILRAVHISPSVQQEPERNLEGVSLWHAAESPWRPCRHLIIADFTEGFYPGRPVANPLFLDGEIEAIRAATGLSLRGRAERLAHSLSLFEEQLRAVAETATFLVPWRELSGARLAPSAGLSLVARAIDRETDGSGLVVDLSRLPSRNWPVPHHIVSPEPELPPSPRFLNFPARDLLSLRVTDGGSAKPQSPSRLETLLVSPLAWLLGELGAEEMAWSAEELDLITKGNIAHDVFEHVFTPDLAEWDDHALTGALTLAFDRALSRHASFLRGISWDLERRVLEREILEAALRWRDHLIHLDAKILGNEIWLAGEVHGVRLHGKADVILELPDGTVLVVDHKKSGSAGRRKRMQSGWDLQAGLYRDMIANPIRREGDAMAPLIGRKVAIAYHLMNDGVLLTSGLAVAQDFRTRDMGIAVEAFAVERLKVRLAELLAGRIVLNTETDEGFFTKEAGFTPYALTDGSPLVRAFICPTEETQA